MKGPGWRPSPQAALFILRCRLQRLGLQAFGGFPTKGQKQTLVLVGNAGPGFWQAFEASGPRDEQADPLDRWTRAVLSPLGEDLGADVFFPFDGPPYPPFQTWALRARIAWPSPLGPLIHPRFGLWFAFRAAFLLPGRIFLTPKAGHLQPSPCQPSPCEGCLDKPCLTACPAKAVLPSGLDVSACRTYLGTNDGALCFAECCQARRACPEGMGYGYHPGQSRFHMRAFQAGLGSTGPASHPSR